MKAAALPVDREKKIIPTIRPSSLCQVFRTTEPCIQYFLGWEPILACFPRMLTKDDNTLVATLSHDPFAELHMKIPGMLIANFHQIIVRCTFIFASYTSLPDHLRMCDWSK
jgi:hypothetical protein